MILRMHRPVAIVCMLGYLLAIDKPAQALPHRTLEMKPEAIGVRAITPENTLEALNLPMNLRFNTLREQGPEGYRNLRDIMFDRRSKIEARWRATMAVGRLAGALSLPELERATKAEVWELRSAALLAVSRFDRVTASKWARELLQDPALLVRVTAVQTLEAIKDRGAVGSLWAQLDSQRNFKHQRSLFIRRRIVEALGKLEGSGSESRFVALLSDDDATLHPAAIGALERLTGTVLGKPGDRLARRRALWQEWPEKNRIRRLE